MKKILWTLLTFAVIGYMMTSCSGSQKSSAATEDVVVSEEEQGVFNQSAQDTVKIQDLETQYEIIIIEPGFYTWLVSIARPEGYYSQHFLEVRNYLYVMEYNRRVLQPLQFDPDLYVLQIDYDPKIDYGYEVNYKLYNYFIYMQRKYNQRLGPYIPRI